jgi:hypothetical protein
MKMKEHEKIYTPSTQLNTRCIWETQYGENQLEGEAYALLSFLQLWKASTKKEALTMEFPLTLWPEWLLQISYLLCYSLKIPLLGCSTQLWNKYNTKEWNPFSS